MRHLYEFHVNGVLPRSCNSSFITLIPVVEDMQELDEFRSTSLFGCIYKIVAKILSSRSNKVLEWIIDRRPMAFIRVRNMLDGGVGN